MKSKTRKSGHLPSLGGARNQSTKRARPKSVGQSTVPNEDSGVKRCHWVTSDPIYIKYHDEEWGYPVHDDKKHFEFLILEAAQAGLSWLTVLRKLEGYRQAFANFDPVKVARFDAAKIESLMVNPAIIRNRLKIAAAIHNAKLFIGVQKEFGSFDAYFWSFVNNSPVINQWSKPSDIPATTPLSNIFSKDLKRRGFKFVGPTVIYSHMQACGMVDDHLVTCFRRTK